MKAICVCIYIYIHVYTLNHVYIYICMYVCKYVIYTYTHLCQKNTVPCPHGSYDATSL